MSTLTSPAVSLRGPRTRLTPLERLSLNVLRMLEARIEKRALRRSGDGRSRATLIAAYEAQRATAVARAHAGMLSA